MTNNYDIDELRLGYKLWRRLLNEGGLVWTEADGTKHIIFKRTSPSPELAAALRSDLRKYMEDYIDYRHARLDEAYSRPID